MTAEPVVIRVRRYRCPFCNYSRASRVTVTGHIARCWSNPAVNACKSCDFFQRFETGYCGARPGCRCQDIPEGCGKGHNLEDGIRTNCPDWRQAA